MRIILIRCLVHAGGLAAMFASFRYLPLADAIAIAFVFPFILLLLGHVFLKEHVGIRRLTACSVGFIGTLLIIQPSFAAVGLPALLPLLVAVLFAVLVLMTRQIAKEYDPICLQSTSGFVGLILLIASGLMFRDTDIFDLQLLMPPPSAWGTLFLVGFFGTLAHISMTYAVRFAPSATLAPMQYVEIPLATFIGWVVFGELPNGLAAVGILITVIAGLAVIYFEHRANRAPPLPAAPQDASPPDASSSGN
jgi:drug/metabolite transporter (DMT)-like permease